MHEIARVESGIPMHLIVGKMERNDTAAQRILQTDPPVPLTPEALPPFMLYVGADDLRAKLPKKGIAEPHYYDPQEIVKAFQELGVTRITRTNLRKLLERMDKPLLTSATIRVIMEELRARGISHFAYSGAEGHIFSETTPNPFEQVEVTNHEEYYTSWGIGGNCTFSLGNGELMFFHKDPGTGVEGQD